MKTKLTIVLLCFIVITSCHLKNNQEVKSDENLDNKDEKNLLIGSWVEPNPINEKEVQGFKIKEDGSMESINMATLVYKKWWKASDKLYLVSESIGNSSTSIDTTAFEITTLSEGKLEIKAENYSLTYKRQ